MARCIGSIAARHGEKYLPVTLCPKVEKAKKLPAAKVARPPCQPTRERVEQELRPPERTPHRAGSAAVGLPAQPGGVTRNFSVRATEKAAGQRRPLPGNSPDDRKDYPDFASSQESLRRSPIYSSRGPGWRFPGMTESIGPMGTGIRPEDEVPPPVGRPSVLSKERDGRSALWPIVHDEFRPANP